MSIPDYINFIGEVSASCGVGQNLEQRIREAWTKYEELASRLSTPYDILATNITGSGFRDHSRLLISLLYQTDSGIPASDCEQILTKDNEYGGSWHKRGGTGAFHALARKGDRLVNQLDKYVTINNARLGESAESIDDTLGDLRRYLILVEAWHVARDTPKKITPITHPHDYR